MCIARLAMPATDATVLLCCCCVVCVYCCRSFRAHGFSVCAISCYSLFCSLFFQVWGWDMPTGLHQLFETIVDSGIEKESVESAQQRAKFSVETLDGRGVFEVVDVEGMGNE